MEMQMEKLSLILRAISSYTEDLELVEIKVGTPPSSVANLMSHTSLLTGFK